MKEFAWFTLVWALEFWKNASFLFLFSKILVPILEGTKQIPSFPTLGYMSGGSIKKIDQNHGFSF